MAIENAITWNTFNFNSNTKNLTASSPNAWYTEADPPDGLWGFDFAAEQEKVPQGVGVRFFDEFKEGNTITVPGTIVARDLASLRKAELTMAEATWDLTNDKLYFQLEGQVPMYVHARVGQGARFTLDRSQRYPIREAYVVAFRLLDPRFYKVSDDSLAFAWMS